MTGVKPVEKNKGGINPGVVGRKGSPSPGGHVMQTEPGIQGSAVERVSNTEYIINKGALHV